jgi:anaerobic selenocysteine-containing dehydrogenase
MLLPEYIEQGKIKAVFSMGTNLMMWPNSDRFADALGKLELFTTCDFFANPTVDVANVFFPAATSLERQALIVAPIGKVQYRPAAVPPRGEARGDTEMLFGMANALGLGGKFWDGDIHASFDERLEATGLSFADLPEDGKAVKVELEKRLDRGYRKNGFGTPTGKVEFDAMALRDAGHDGLPTYAEPYLSPEGSPEVAKDFPLVLTSGGRSNNYTHSQGRMLETLRKREPDPRLQISPEDALARDIRDGDPIQVSSPTGKIEVKAWVTEIMAPGVVHGFHGWAGANINSLIPDGEALDPISGYPPFKSCLCQVEGITA